MAMNHMMMQLVRRHEMLVQAHKLKAVGTLTAGVAHELNNPINNIMLTAETLREDYEDLPDEERLDMVNDLVAQSERAQKIVRNLLDFARESEIESEAHEVQDLIEDTLRLATNQIKLAKVKVKGDLAPNLPPVYGDRQQLEQVFLNIVLNALDAMPEGGTLSISCNSTSGSGARLRGVHRHGRRDTRTEDLRHLQSILHHQARCQGNRSRTLRLVGNHPATRRRHQGEE